MTRVPLLPNLSNSTAYPPLKHDTTNAQALAVCLSIEALRVEGAGACLTRNSSKIGSRYVSGDVGSYYKILAHKNEARSENTQPVQVGETQ